MQLLRFEPEKLSDPAAELDVDPERVDGGLHR
jgi:hypothetical protein